MNEVELKDKKYKPLKAQVRVKTESIFGHTKPADKKKEEK